MTIARAQIGMPLFLSDGRGVKRLIDEYIYKITALGTAPGRGQATPLGRGGVSAAAFWYARALVTASDEEVGPLALWPLDDNVGSGTAREIAGHASGPFTGTPSNVTFGGAGIGDETTAAEFNGTASRINYYSVAFRDTWDVATKNKGTLMAWVKVTDANVWLDSTERFIISAGFTDRVRMYKRTSAQTRWERNDDGGLKSQQSGFSSVDWFLMAMTWDLVGNETKYYRNGVQDGATDACGNFGDLLHSIYCQIGARNTTSRFWDGSIGPVAFWHGLVPEADILALASV